MYFQQNFLTAFQWGHLKAFLEGVLKNVLNVSETCMPLELLAVKDPLREILSGILVVNEVINNNSNDIVINNFLKSI